MSDTPPPFTALHRLLLIPAAHPRLTLAVATVVVALSALSAYQIRAVPSLKPLFGENDPAAQAMVRVLDDFAAADDLMVLATAPPDTAPDRVIEELRGFAERLERAIAEDPAAASMVAFISYQPGQAIEPFIEEQIAPAGLYYLTDEQLDLLRQRLEPESIRAQVRRNESLITAASPMTDALSGQILKDPLGLSEFLIASLQLGGPGADRQNNDSDLVLGTDGRSLLIRISATEPASNIEFTKAFMPVMRDAVERARPGVLNIEYTGAYPIAELSERVIRGDMTLSVISSIFLIQLLFLFAYRHLWSFPVTFVPVVVGILAGFGVYAFFSPRLTPVTAASGAILAGLGVDYCIHFLSHYHSRRRAGESVPEAIRDSLGLSPAMFAACVTSMIGFLVLSASNVPALRDFAFIGALGLAGAFLGSVVLLPAMLQLVDRKPESNAPLRFHLDDLMRGVGRHARAPIIATLLILALAGTALLTRGMPAFQSDMSVLQPGPSPPVDAQAHVAALFPGSIDSMLIHLEADSPDALLRDAHELDRMLRTMPPADAGGAEIFSVATLLPDPATVSGRREAIQAIDTDRVIADFRAAIDDSVFDIAAYDDYLAFLRAALTAEAPPGLETLARYPRISATLLPRSAFDPGGPPTTQALTVMNLHDDLSDTPEELIIRERLRDAIANLPGTNATATGLDLIADDVEATIRFDLEWLLPIAGALVAVWLLIVTRRPSRMALTLIPPIFCMVSVLAIMTLAGQSLNIINVIALPLLAGIGVDDGIFLVSIAARHREERGVDRLLEDLAASCHAITMTSLTTVLAFGSLMLTRTEAIRSLGFVLAVGMLACWIASVFLLAPILIAWHRRRTTPAA